MAEPQRIRFHLDEQMDPDIAFALRRAGIDVTTAGDLKLLGHPDEAHFGHARAEGRVIVLLLVHGVYEPEEMIGRIGFP